MDTDNEPTLIELEMRLRRYYDEMKQLIKEKDSLITLIMEVEFKIFNRKNWLPTFCQNAKNANEFTLF